MGSASLLSTRTWTTISAGLCIIRTHFFAIIILRGWMPFSKKGTLSQRCYQHSKRVAELKLNRTPHFFSGVHTTNICQKQLQQHATFNECYFWAWDLQMWRFGNCSLLFGGPRTRSRRCSSSMENTANRFNRRIFLFRLIWFLLPYIWPLRTKRNVCSVCFQKSISLSESSIFFESPPTYF